VMMITASGVIIRVQADEISKIGRNTQGVRIMKLKGNNVSVMAIALTPHEEAEEEPTEGDENTTVEGEAVDVTNAQETTDAVETAEEAVDETEE
ncbi:MAG: DNA gyrase subunit A, partial [Clostridia bacterium]|nr:DNA gyrase subunit A [Clostridia bacterium]